MSGENRFSVECYLAGTEPAGRERDVRVLGLPTLRTLLPPSRGQHIAAEAASSPTVAVSDFNISVDPNDGWTDRPGRFGLGFGAALAAEDDGDSDFLLTGSESSDDDADDDEGMQ